MNDMKHVPLETFSYFSSKYFAMKIISDVCSLRVFSKSYFALQSFFIGVPHPWQNRNDYVGLPHVPSVCGLALDLLIESSEHFLIQFYLWALGIDHFSGPAAWIGDLELGALGSSSRGVLFLPSLC